MFLSYVFRFLCFSVITKQSFQHSTPSDAYYTAGVVEFRRANNADMTSSDILADNLAAYRSLIASPEANHTDIIVFPESSLNNDFELTYVPDPRENPLILCDQPDGYHDFLVQLSCSAKNSKKYILINVSEKENCSRAMPEDTRPCAVSGINKFNTNVVFDRSGQVISRYRKVHVYVEDRNTTLLPEMGTFETDFGVRFGHFICFDILFYSPAQEMAVTSGIRDFIFPNNWYSELPFLTAVQLQASWSYGNDVNLLAAGASAPDRGSTGSGIYAGRDGVLVSTMVGGGAGERKLLVGKILKKNFRNFTNSTLTPKTTHRARQFGIRLMQDYQIEKFNSKLIDYAEESTEVCHEKLCCHFFVRTKRSANALTSTASTYVYRFGAFNGDRVYEKAEKSALKICAIYACTNETAASCGTIFPSDTDVGPNLIFDEIIITGRFPKASRLLLTPNSLDQALYPLPVESFQWNVTEINNDLDVRFNLVQPSDNILTFAIYGNYYEGSMAAKCAAFDVYSYLLISVILSLMIKIKFTS